MSHDGINMDFSFYYCPKVRPQCPKICFFFHRGHVVARVLCSDSHSCPANCAPLTITAFYRVFRQHIQTKPSGKKKKRHTSLWWERTKTIHGFKTSAEVLRFSLRVEGALVLLVFAFRQLFGLLLKILLLSKVKWPRCEFMWSIAKDFKTGKYFSVFLVPL